jgi:hypothetical protein
LKYLSISLFFVN